MWQRALWTMMTSQKSIVWIRRHRHPSSSWGQFHQQIFEQLLRVKILKAQKVAWIDCFFVLLGSECVKAARKMLVKLTTDAAAAPGPTRWHWWLPMRFPSASIPFKTVPYILTILCELYYKKLFIIYDIYINNEIYTCKTSGKMSLGSGFFCYIKYRWR